MLCETPEINKSKTMSVDAETALHNSGNRNSMGPAIVAEDEVEEFDDDYNKDIWDEGGRSDCGYSDGVHDTLMSIGEKVYSVLGEPSELLRKRMKGIGSFFQEASYAVRDLKRGNLSVKGEDLAVIEKDGNLPYDFERSVDDLMPTDVEMTDERTATETLA